MNVCHRCMAQRYTSRYFVIVESAGYFQRILYISRSMSTSYIDSSLFTHQCSYGKIFWNMNYGWTYQFNKFDSKTKMDIFFCNNTVYFIQYVLTISLNDLKFSIANVCSPKSEFSNFHQIFRFFRYIYSCGKCKHSVLLSSTPVNTQFIWITFLFLSLRIEAHLSIVSISCQVFAV